MNRWTTSALLAVLLLFSNPALAEHVFLTDGSILEGIIIRENAKTVTLKKNDGSRERINRSDIMRILYTKLNMGKVYVQKRDGTGMEVYLVDEDSDTYTFRRVLTDPDEFKLKRSQVLFIAEKNPSGLEAKANPVSLELKWYPPYNKVKKYNIYIKGPSDEDYRLADTAGSTGYTLDDLESNTKYTLKVTAIDTDGYESSPSNILKISKLNIPPEEPEIIDCRRSVSSDRKSLDACLEWEEAADADGSVQEYTVYRMIEDSYQKVASVKNTSYSFTDLDPLETYRFAVRSVDDRGELSDWSYGMTRRQYPVVLGIRGYSLIPTGDYGDLYSGGYGGLVTLSLINIPFKNLYSGITTGYYSFNAKNERVDSATIVPVYLNLFYRYQVTERINILPSISAGYAMHTVTYQARDNLGHLQPAETKRAYEPVAMGGVDVSYSVLQWLAITAGGHYGITYETEGTMAFYGITAGIMTRIGL